jgi:hypothetical protein
MVIDKFHFLAALTLGKDLQVSYREGAAGLMRNGKKSLFLAENGAVILRSSSP